MSTACVCAAELCGVAGAFNEGVDRHLGASRQLVACVLLRQVLEEAMGSWWDRTVPGLGDCSTRAQLVSLAFYLPDARLARDVVFAWNCLTQACHHHAYDLAPAPSEVARLVETVERFLAAVGEPAG